MMRDCDASDHQFPPNVGAADNTHTNQRQRRYDDKDRKRSDARQVARFHEECVAQARAFSTLSLPSPLVDPAALVDKIVGACNGDFGTVLYVSATSPSHQLLFESYCSGEDKLRAGITTQQKREDDARNEVNDNARYLLASFNGWITMLRRVKRQKKTLLQCTAFVARYRRWTQSLYLLTHGSRRLRFLAVSRRKRQHDLQSNHRPQAEAHRYDAEAHRYDAEAHRYDAEAYDSMFS
jgi:hypothetical protein